MDNMPMWLNWVFWVFLLLMMVMILVMGVVAIRMFLQDTKKKEERPFYYLRDRDNGHIVGSTRYPEYYKDSYSLYVGEKIQ